jgi:hypothetical protein
LCKYLYCVCRGYFVNRHQVESKTYFIKLFIKKSFFPPQLRLFFSENPKMEGSNLGRSYSQNYALFN